MVLMGMGEPLHNFTEVVEALWRAVNVIGISKRRITLSTVGIVPKMKDLAQKAPRINLAVSLNATTGRIRNSIMPVNRKYPLQTLINACKQFPLEPGRRITFEYVLLRGINDSREDALRLTKLLKGIRSKVNVIPYNPIVPVQHETITHSKSHGIRLKHRDSVFKKPPDDVVIRFQEILRKAGITAIVRKSKGADICAACGQLKAGYSPSSFLTTFKSS
jgi:23S rRNA (adenine2503-C2)-methyltransferase